MQYEQSKTVVFFLEKCKCRTNMAFIKIKYQHKKAIKIYYNCVLSDLRAVTKRFFRKEAGESAPEHYAT